MSAQKWSDLMAGLPPEQQQRIREGTDALLAATPAGAAPRDEARDLDPMLRATAHWPPLTDDQLQMLAAEGALGSIAAMEILRLRAAAPRADPYEATLRQLSATFQTRWDDGANGLERSIWCEAKVNVDEAIRAAARAPGREP